MTTRPQQHRAPPPPQTHINRTTVAKGVEFLRDTRHLAGRSPITHTPRPPNEGLAIAVKHDATGHPHLLVAHEDHQVHEISTRNRLDLLVEAPRHCVGQREGETWTPCPHSHAADRFTRCPECHPLPVRECVFNPRCTDCKEAFCRSPHEVYIAYHGTAKKVGMTRKAREGGRLVEQGADCAFIIAETPDRFQARNLEDRVTSILKIPQVLPHKHRLARLTRAVPLEAIRADHETTSARVEPLTGTPCGPLICLPRATQAPLQEVPVPVATIGHHVGTVVGAHGRYLFYRHADDDHGPLWALDLKDVVTHRVAYA